MNFDVSAVMAFLLAKYPMLKIAVDMFRITRWIENVVAETKAFRIWAVVVPFQRTRIMSLPPASLQRRCRWAEGIGLAAAGLAAVGSAVHLGWVAKPDAALENAGIFLVLYFAGVLAAMRGVNLIRLLRI